jgi:hypothetical protein
MPWPTSVQPFPTRINGEVVDASHLNLVQQEVTALETDLLGAWSTRAFNAAHYSATGGGTWTNVTVVSFAWKKLGRTVYVNFALGTGTITGVVNNLVITLPVPTARFAVGQVFMDENGVPSLGVIDVANSAIGNFRIFKLGLVAFTPGVATLQVRGQITYESLT